MGRGLISALFPLQPEVPLINYPLIISFDWLGGTILHSTMHLQAMKAWHAGELRSVVELRWLVHSATILAPMRLCCLSCTKFGQLILRKVVKIVATRCHILRLKCTRPRPRLGSSQRSPNPVADLRGFTSKRREGRTGKGRKGEGKEDRTKTRGRRKGKKWTRRKREVKKEGKVTEGINLPHGRLETLAALLTWTFKGDAKVLANYFYA